VVPRPQVLLVLRVLRIAAPVHSCLAAP
jgi:hypothetical protein